MGILFEVDYFAEISIEYTLISMVPHQMFLHFTFSPLNVAGIHGARLYSIVTPQMVLLQLRPLDHLLTSHCLVLAGETQPCTNILQFQVPGLRMGALAHRTARKPVEAGPAHVVAQLARPDRRREVVRATGTLDGERALPVVLLQGRAFDQLVATYEAVLAGKVQLGAHFLQHQVPGFGLGYVAHGALWKPVGTGVAHAVAHGANPYGWCEVV